MNWRAFLLVLLLPLLALAQEPAKASPSPDPSHPPVETIPPGEDKIVPLKQGEKAPYDGQLFSVDTSIRWGNWLQQYRYRLIWDVELEKQVCTEEITYRDNLLTIEKDRASKTEESFREALQRSEKARLIAEEAARNPPWYSTVEFGVVVGAVSAVAILAVAVWALEARNP